MLVDDSNETARDLQNELDYIYLRESSDENDSSDSDYNDYF